MPQFPDAYADAYADADVGQSAETYCTTSEQEHRITLVAKANRAAAL